MPVPYLLALTFKIEPYRLRSYGGQCPPLPNYTSPIMALDDNASLCYTLQELSTVLQFGMVDLL
ncbi:MAG: hypothetical protein FWD97_03960 [Defluviitaleaceae bacterium]|nr:hypothetical protein [Defluviitaleaceae bacterium]